MTMLAAYNGDEASGPILDVTGNGHDIALGSNLVRTSITIPGRGAGTGWAKNAVGLPVVSTPALAETTNRSFGFWLQGTGNSVWVFRNYIIADDTGSWGFYILGGNGNLRIRKSGSNTNISTPFPSDGNPHYWAGTYDGSNSRLYLDAVLVATSGTVTAPLQSADRTEIMEGSVTSQIMEDLRIADELWSQPQIASFMTTPVTAGASLVLTGTMLKAIFDADATVTASAVLSGNMPKALAVMNATVSASATLGAAMPRMLANFDLSEQLPGTAVLQAVMSKMIAGTGQAVVSQELKVQRMLTKSFIDSAPVNVVLVPHQRVTKPSGGVAMTAQTPRPSQVFRLIPMSHTEHPARSSSTAATSDEGKQRRYDYTLLGEWNSEMNINDQWETPDGQILVIENMVSFNNYEKKGLVISYGGKPSHA